MKSTIQIIFILICIFSSNILYAQYEKNQRLDTLYFEESSVILDSIQINSKIDILKSIEDKYFSKKELPVIIVDGILINNTNLNWNRDTLTGKFWDGHCGCYGSFFDKNYESIKEIYFLKNKDFNFKNNALLLRTKNIVSKSKKKKQTK